MWLCLNPRLASACARLPRPCSWGGGGRVQQLLLTGGRGDTRARPSACGVGAERKGMQNVLGLRSVFSSLLLTGDGS